jgi:hypothetical protein
MKFKNISLFLFSGLTIASLTMLTSCSHKIQMIKVATPNTFENYNFYDIGSITPTTHASLYSVVDENTITTSSPTIEGILFKTDRQATCSFEQIVMDDEETGKTISMEKVLYNTILLVPQSSENNFLTHLKFKGDNPQGDDATNIEKIKNYEPAMGYFLGNQNENHFDQKVISTSPVDVIQSSKGEYAMIIKDCNRAPLTSTNYSIYSMYLNATIIEENSSASTTVYDIDYKTNKILELAINLVG